MRRTVFRIKKDVTNYQYFLPAEKASIIDLDDDCLPIKASWKPPEVYIYQPKLKQGDFFNFTSNLLIANTKAIKILASHFEMAGEILPLYHEGIEYGVVNILECINCLNKNKTEWEIDEETGDKAWIDKYAFHPERFSESSLFKIPETSRGEILLVEGLLAPEEEFRYLVKEAGLEGLKFEELWRSD
jgi:hypothetical protein